MPQLAPRHMVKSSKPTNDNVPNVATTPNVPAVAKQPDTKQIPESEVSTPTSVSALPDPMAVKFDPNNPPHVEVKALAGTGKTTTITQGMMAAKGLPITIVPSEQQQAIFDMLKLGKQVRATFGAFGNAIAAQLKKVLEQCGLSRYNCEAKTMHSMGNYAIRRTFGHQEPEEYYHQRLACEVLQADPRVLRGSKPELLRATEALVSLCKCNLREPTPENLLQLASYYEVDFGTEVIRKEVLDLVPKVMELSREPKGSISFDDMVWLPNVLNLNLYKSDILLGDEVQDWNLAQQGIAAKASDRIILCGDEHQSIFGFAGADVEAMQRQRDRLGAELRGCIILPLTVTRRCSQAVVREAQRHVPEFQAHPDNPEGEVIYRLYPLQKKYDGWQELPLAETYLPHVREGDMVLCRWNAPLVSQCFKQISMGRNAYILGRKIGDSLIQLIQKLNASSLLELTAKVDDWLDKELSIEKQLRFPLESKMGLMRDKRQCVLTFIKDSLTVQDVLDRINAVFADKDRPGIRHSSIHKAKGLESNNVFLLQPPDLLGRKVKAEWEAQQEDNLLYVAKTRAKLCLTYVQ